MRRAAWVLGLSLIAGRVWAEPGTPGAPHHGGSRNEKALRHMAGRILKTTTYRFVNVKSKETYESLRGVALNPDVQVESPYNDWHYTNGVLNLGMLELSAKLKDPQYEKYVDDNMDFVFGRGHLDYFQRLYDQ